MSPIQPKNLAAPIAQSKRIRAPTISEASHSALYTMLALKVPNFERFAPKWNDFGTAMTGRAILAYDPKTFINDYMKDLSTVAMPLDRPTAVQIFDAVVALIREDPQISYSKRRSWVLASCDILGTEVPAPYDDDTFSRYAREDDAARHEKRRRTIATENFVNVDDDERSDDAGSRHSSSDEDLPLQSTLDAFSLLQRQPLLNANTVWSKSAGFTIVPHETILEIHKKKAQEIASANVNAAKSATVRWPKLLTWTQDAWYAFDKEWWNCVVEAVQSGVYQTMISLIDLNIIDDIQIDLKIDPDKWFEVSEIDFIRKTHGHFGPNNKEEALVILREAECVVYKKGPIAPDVFLKLLSSYNTTFLRILDLQIAPSIKKWPAAGQAKSGPLTLKTIRKAFKDGFVKCKDTSSSCKHCYDVIDMNPDMSHRELYIELRTHFQEDAKSLKRGTMNGGSTLVKGPQDQRQNGGRNNRTPSVGSSANPSTNTDRNAKRPISKPDFKVVPGKDRCGACGDYTNHYGKGIKFCPYAGTKHAKPKGYKWDDSDKEPKVSIPNSDFQQLRKDKADIFKQNAANRIEYRKSVASKSKHYSSSAADFAFVDIQVEAETNCGVMSIAESRSQLVSHDGNTYSMTPPERSCLIDIINMGNRFSDVCISLEDIGFSERFFGVAKFNSIVSTSNVAPKSDVVLFFNRDVDVGRYKRAPRCMCCRIVKTSDANIISAKAMSQSSKYGMLKICDTRHSSNLKSDPRTRVLLEFVVGHDKHKDSSKVCRDWFIIDDAANLCEHSVLVTPSFLSTHGLSNDLQHHDTTEAIHDSHSVVGRVFFDTGAQMSCIAPHLVLPSLCVNKAAINVKVMQGIHEAGFSKQAVQLCFDLYDNQFEPTRYTEWFLVWDNPYGVILGDSFCDQFTTWKQLLASWSSNDTVSKFNVSKTFTTWTPFVNESNASSITNPNADEPTRKRHCADTSHMISKHPVTGTTLRHRHAGSRPIVQTLDHRNYIPYDGLRPAGLLHESAKRADRYMECKFKEKRLLTMLQTLPKNDRVSFDVAEMQNSFAKEQRSMCLQIMHDIVGLPAGLMMGTGAGGIVRRASLFDPIASVPLACNEVVTPEIAKQTAAERYLLQRSEAKEWTWSDDDDATYLQLLELEHVPLGTVIKSSPLTESQKYFVNWLIRAIHQSHSNNKSVMWTAEQDKVSRDLELRAAVIVNVAAVNTTSLPAAAPHSEALFEPGTVVEFVNCTRLTEFNGKLGRLYEQCDDDTKRWKIRVLGRNHGQFVIASNDNFVRHVEQKRFTSATDANFHDVGIDDSGMPIESDVDAPKPVHRQFGKEYSAELTRRIKEVVARYPQLFDGDISQACDFEEMDIQLKPNAILPSKARYYRNTPLMREEVRRQIQEQLDAGIISKMPTAVVSNVLMVKRPHMPGRYRFVVDYRSVNEATVPDVLLMPDVKSQHDRLANKKIFGAVDISSYYRLIKLKESCRYLTGFATEDGTYVYNRVPMGVRNACSHAQRVLQDKLADDPVLGINGANIRNYFDDIAWGSNSEDEFILVLTALMEFGVRHRLKYNMDKSCFGVDSITHVGFIADKDGIRIDPERTKDIVDMVAPKSTNKVQSILGTLNFVRNFIPNFSIKAKFLTDRLEKSAVKRDAGKKFVWSASDAACFEELKHLVASAPLLSVLDYGKDIYIRCDSSRYGAGAVLFQYDSVGREMPVCYASRKYTPTETRYSTFQQEMGCVVWALERFQEYTLGYKVIVETDHRNISFVKRSAMPQLARWRMRLEAFDFDVHYRCGALQQVADGLSRSACDEEGIDAVAIHYKDVLPENCLQHASPAGSLAIMNVDAINVSTAANDSTVAMTPLCNYNDDESPLVRMWVDDVHVEPVEANAVEDGALFDDSEFDNALPLPWDNAAAIKTMIESVHNDVAGHGGVLVTLQRLLRRGTPVVSRKQMLLDIDNYLKGCVGCQKMRKRSSGSAVTRRVISGSPFSDLSIDILKLPFPDAYGNVFIVVIVDNFSHWTTTYACANKSAMCAARALIHHIGTFGAPLRIRSDGGGEFVNDIIKQLSHMLSVRQIVIQPYLHSANGIVERVNRSVLERLRYILFDRRIKKQPNLQWTDLLPLAQRIINASTHSAIGTSPARIIFGDHLDLDRVILSRPPKPFVNKVVPDYISQLSDMQAALMEAANEHQLLVQKKIIDKAVRDNRDKPVKILQAGDLVLIKPLSDFPHDKLAPSLLGPLRVDEILAGGLVRVIHPHSSKISTVSDFQCELFDQSLISSTEGIKIVAETDSFEFAVESILAHGLLPDNEDEQPTALPANHVRKVRAKNYAFLIKWTGYESPTWIAFKAARRLPHFANYVGQFPSLKMNEHS